MHAFVPVRLELDHRHELMLADGPVSVTVRPVDLRRSTVKAPD